LSQTYETAVILDELRTESNLVIKYRTLEADAYIDSFGNPVRLIFKVM
jgi:hypothetical protein